MGKLNRFTQQGLCLGQVAGAGDDRRADRPPLRLRFDVVRGGCRLRRFDSASASSSRPWSRTMRDSSAAIVERK